MSGTTSKRYIFMIAFSFLTGGVGAWPDRPHSIRKNLTGRI